MRLQPDSAEAYSNLGVALQDQGRLGGGGGELSAGARDSSEIFAPAHQGLLFCLSHSGEVSPELLFREHLRFAEIFEAPLRAEWPHHRTQRDPERPLRIGFVSGDLRQHAMSSFIEPVFAHLAKQEGLSLHAYSTRAAEDEMTVRLREHVPNWHRVFALSDAELAAKIQADAHRYSGRSDGAHRAEPDADVCPQACACAVRLDRLPWQQRARQHGLLPRGSLLSSSRRVRSLLHREDRAASCGRAVRAEPGGAGGQRACRRWRMAL